MKIKSLIGASLLGLSVACAPIPSSYQPVVDSGAPGFKWSNYYADLEECRAYARQVSVANQSVGEALLGSALGAAFGAILDPGTGHSGRIAGYGASAGALSGITHGAGSALQEQKRIIGNCMRGRGYRVLN